MYGSTLLTFQVSNFKDKNRQVALEWPINYHALQPSAIIYKA